MRIDFDARESTLVIGERSFSAPLPARYTQMAGARLALRSAGFVAADDLVLVALPQPRTALLTLLGLMIAGARVHRAARRPLNPR